MLDKKLKYYNYYHSGLKKLNYLYRKYQFYSMVLGSTKFNNTLNLIEINCYPEFKEDAVTKEIELYLEKIDKEKYRGYKTDMDDLLTLYKNYITISTSIYINNEEILNNPKIVDVLKELAEIKFNINKKIKENEYTKTEYQQISTLSQTG